MTATKEDLYLTELPEPAPAKASPYGKPIIWFHEDIHGNVVRTTILPEDLHKLKSVRP